MRKRPTSCWVTWRRHSLLWATTWCGAPWPYLWEKYIGRVKVCDLLPSFKQTHAHIPDSTTDEGQHKKVLASMDLTSGYWRSRTPTWPTSWQPRADTSTASHQLVSEQLLTTSSTIWMNRSTPSLPAGSVKRSNISSSRAKRVVPTQAEESLACCRDSAIKFEKKVDFVGFVIDTKEEGQSSTIICSPKKTEALHQYLNTQSIHNS